MTENDNYFRYWGKAAKAPSKEYHLLVYHCLDVAAVGSAWLQLNQRILNAFCNSADFNPKEVRAWILFFLSLHDIGKFDVRFQQKALHIWQKLQNSKISTRLSPADSRNYFHGPAGLYWFGIEFDEIVLGQENNATTANSDSYDFFWDDDETVSEDWNVWKPWLEAVTGHHGHLVNAENNSVYRLPSDCPRHYSDQDKNARRGWIHKLENLFLKPDGLSLKQMPPQLSSKAFLAGFCSVADWLGSANSEDRFQYFSEAIDLKKYFEHRCQDASDVLRIAGLIGRPKPYKGVKALLKNEHTPHQIQTVVDNLNCASGLVLVEAPTGSGKTEAALAFAWRLLEAGEVESIIFALPTQATSNAMLNRLELLATTLFEEHPNLLLAHGNARFNAGFIRLREQGRLSSGSDQEAWAQCCEWLAQSRKRAFLGQIGVCTIDQVLTSVLPVRHRFVRSFGLGRSVLIVDEVHAYDTYMYGLLKAVLAEQKSANGSVILLSATLPDNQRKELFHAWDAKAVFASMSTPSPYPLVSQITSDLFEEHLPVPSQMPSERKVWVEHVCANKCMPPTELIRQIVGAAESGANIAVVCNLVDMSQNLFNEIYSITRVPIILFHSRFTLTDRQKIEALLSNRFGAESQMPHGAILIATQVVEQSLDVDFDWMITQLCPVDLFLQRLGRLHRHPWKNIHRPPTHTRPHCTVLLPDSLDYGPHGLIYPNSRVMWRTAQKIEKLNDDPIIFPKAFRHWVEQVYSETAWGTEPEEVENRYQEFLDKHQSAQKFAAQLMLNSTQNMTPLLDDDQQILAVTRDGERQIATVPYVQTPEGRRLRDNAIWERSNPLDRHELLAMNMVCVPHSWHAVLDKHISPEEGIYWLPMEASNDEWRSRMEKWELCYNQTKGLERIK